MVCIKHKLVWELINFLSSMEILFSNRAGVLAGAPAVFQHLNRTRCFFPKIHSVAVNAARVLLTTLHCTLKALTQKLAGEIMMTVLVLLLSFWLSLSV